MNVAGGDEISGLLQRDFAGVVAAGEIHDDVIAETDGGLTETDVDEVIAIAGIDVEVTAEFEVGVEADVKGVVATAEVYGQAAERLWQGDAECFDGLASFGPAKFRAGSPAAEFEASGGDVDDDKVIAVIAGDVDFTVAGDIDLHGAASDWQGDDSGGDWQVAFGEPDRHAIVGGSDVDRSGGEQLAVFKELDFGGGGRGGSGGVRTARAAVLARHDWLTPGNSQRKTSHPEIKAGEGHAGQERNGGQRGVGCRGRSVAGRFGGNGGSCGRFGWIMRGSLEAGASAPTWRCPAKPATCGILTQTKACSTLHLQLNLQLTEL